MPQLLSRYVWDKMGTIIVHRLTNVDSWEVMQRSTGSSPLRYVDRGHDELVLKLPEDLAFYRNHLSDPMMDASNVGTAMIPKVRYASIVWDVPSEIFQTNALQHEAAEISHGIYEEDDFFVRIHMVRRKAKAFHVKYAR